MKYINETKDNFYIIVALATNISNELYDAFDDKTDLIIICILFIVHCYKQSINKYTLF